MRTTPGFSVCFSRPEKPSRCTVPAKTAAVKLAYLTSQCCAIFLIIPIIIAKRFIKPDLAIGSCRDVACYVLIALQDFLPLFGKTQQAASLV